VRVTNFTDTYLPRRDGVITSIRTLVRALAEEGHATQTVVPRHPEQPAEEGLLRLRAVPCGRADLRLSPWLLRGAAADRTLAEVAAHRPDVIHVHTPGPVGLLGVLAARRLGLPLVQTYHTDLHAYAEVYPFPVPALRVGLRLYARRLGVSRPPVRRDPMPVWAGAPTGRRAARAGNRLAMLDCANVLLLGEADAVVVPTQVVLDRIQLPVPGDRIFLVPTGVAARATTPAAVTQLRERYGLREGDEVVLFVGRINREKGIGLLVEAFARVLARRPRAKLLLVGAMYEPRWFDQVIRAAGPGVAARIVHTGEQPPHVVAAAYGTADVFAFASQTDTQALVLQEASLAGVPSVLVDAVLLRCGPLGGAGICTAPTPADFAAAITGLLADPATARQIGAAAKARAVRHTPARYATAMLDVYASAVGVHGARTGGLARSGAGGGTLPVG